MSVTHVNLLYVLLTGMELIWQYIYNDIIKSHILFKEALGVSSYQSTLNNTETLVIL